MEVWLIRNGERYGPFQDYTVRERIGSGELEADARVWHEGLPEWTTLGELELFKKEFGKSPVEVLPPPLPKNYSDRIKVNDGGEKPRAYIVRRFWARWVDLTVYGSVWWLGMYFAGRDIDAAFTNLWMLVTMYIPWFMFEALLIQKFGTTPGKWLLGLKVVNEDGSKLGLKVSIWRALRVLVSGIGFGWGFLSPLCQVMSWFTTRRIGKPIWDYLGRHKLQAVPMNPIKIPLVVLVFVVWAWVWVGVKGPAFERLSISDNPETAEGFKLFQPLYFPERK